MQPVTLSSVHGNSMTAVREPALRPFAEVREPKQRMFHRTMASWPPEWLSRLVDCVVPGQADIVQFAIREGCK